MECGDGSCNPWRRKNRDLFDIFGTKFPDFMEEFSMVIASEMLPESGLIEMDERPFIDVIKGEEDVSVIVEMPGVEKEDIDIRASENHIEIRAERGDRRYHETIKLDCEVVPDKVKATYNNGVLEVVLKRKEPEKQEKKLKRIKVE